MATSTEADYNEIARRISALPTPIKPGDVGKMFAALEMLKQLPFPPGYLDELRDEMYLTLKQGQHVPTSVYLSFYGLNDTASHLKIGIARNVRSRLSSIKTGNPLPNLWVYTARFASRQEAAMVEAALLRHMSPYRAHGEWARVDVSKDSAAELVAALTEVAQECRMGAVTFEPHRFHSGE